MAIKSALTVASIALIATASSLAIAAPSEARTPVDEYAAMSAPSWAKATYHSAESVEEAYEAASRHEPNIVPCLFGLNPSIQPVVNPRIGGSGYLPVGINPRIGGSDYRRVLINPRNQIGSRLHPYPQTAPNLYTLVRVNQYPQR